MKQIASPLVGEAGLHSRPSEGAFLSFPRKRQSRKYSRVPACPARTPEQAQSSLASCLRRQGHIVPLHSA